MSCHFFTVKKNGILFPDVYFLICDFKTLGKEKPSIYEGLYFGWKTGFEPATF